MRTFVIALLLCSSCLGQQVVVVNPQPNVTYAPIKPYGLNLKPAPVHVAPEVSFDSTVAGPGPVTIDNPYYRDEGIFWFQVGWVLGRWYVW